MKNIDPLAPARGILVGIVFGVAMWSAAIGLFMYVMGNQPYENIVPCDTDIDCMEKNPNIEFSLER